VVLREGEVIVDGRAFLGVLAACGRAEKARRLEEEGRRREFTALRKDIAALELEVAAPDRLPRSSMATFRAGFGGSALTASSLGGSSAFGGGSSLGVTRGTGGATVVTGGAGPLPYLPSHLNPSAGGGGPNAQSWAGGGSVATGPDG